VGQVLSLPTSLIAVAVEDAYKYLAQSVIRDYILLLVERRAATLLASNPDRLLELTPTA
jgi:hypothetical protein